MEDDLSSKQLKKNQTDHDRIRLHKAIVVAEKDLAEGRVLTHEQVKDKLAKWLK